MQSTEVVPTGKADPLDGSQKAELPPQLSATLNSNDTTASHRPGAVLVTTSDGQLMTGSSRSSTCTVNTHVTLLLLLSVAVQFTGVVPFGNLAPDGGTHITVGPPHSSATIGAKVSKASQRPGSIGTSMLVEHVRTGGSVSRTVTVKEQLSVLPAASLAVHVT